MKLQKDLGLLGVFCLATGAMVSSGIFVLPGIAHAKAGPSVILSYLIAGLLAGIGMLSTAELATAMPKAGGDYFFITRTLGPAMGSIAGLLNWFSLSLKSAFALIGMAAFVRLFVDVDMRLVGTLLCAVFVGINLAGSRHAGRTQIVLVVGLLVLMVAYVVRGFPHVRMENLTPFMPHGIHRTLATAGFVFVAYGGLIQISSVAEEVRNPARTIPLAIILALLVVMTLYSLMVWVTSGVLPGEQLDQSRTPITDGATVFMGTWGVWAIGLAAILAFVSTANGGIMASSRYLFALGRDELLPRSLSRLTSKSNVPYVAIIATGVFVALSLFLELEILVEAASLVVLMGFILSCACVIILRESRVQNYRPSFRAPLYPFPQIAGILGFGLLIFELGVEAYLISAALFLVGIAAYRFYGRKRVRGDYALLHLVERLTSRALMTGSLESELKEIIRERDEIAEDRFDRLVKDCPVLDLEGPLKLSELFEPVARLLSERTGLSEPELLADLLAREEESSTVLTGELAIPHVVIRGEQIFEIVLIRCRRGVTFSGEAPNIRAVFVLAGTEDERNFHLRALAAIAQIVRTPAFMERWAKARNEQALRDLVLLGDRSRTL
jgi:amino acid transporter/mannitol/fructose-specific phosphotransferase system IIA component (Ntr-type)